MGNLKLILLSAMKKNKKHLTTIEDIEKAEVKLPVILGLEPGKYLAILYAFIILLLLFLLLLYPGLKNRGSMVTFETQVPGAAVLVDGKLIGATPVTAFVEKGERTIEVVKPYFNQVTSKETIGGRLFGSLIFPRKKVISTDLTLQDPAGLLQDAYYQFSEWAMVGKFRENYQPQPVLTLAVMDFYLGGNGVDKAEAESFLQNALRNITHPALLEDFISAYYYHQKGKFLANQDEILQYSIQLEKELEGFADLKTTLEGQTSFRGPGITEHSPVLLGKSVINNLLFNHISGGTFIFRNIDPRLAEKPAILDVKDLWILDREVTCDEFNMFLHDHPEWADTDALAAKGLVTEEYLKYGEGDEPRAWVSWYAADAYCKWLEENLPPAFNGYTVRLPSEEEWEWIAGDSTFGIFGMQHALAVGDRPADKLGFHDLAGNLWEWNENWYRAAEHFFPAYGDSTEDWGGTEKSIRGGSWANKRVNIYPGMRASQPPQWCTPFIGFRPVLVKE